MTSYPNDRSDKNIVVVNSSSPELDYLAAELSRRSVLAKFVRRFAAMDGGACQQLADVVPGGRALYARTFGRRILPPHLDPARVTQAGVAWDFALALAQRLHNGWLRTPLVKLALARRSAAIVSRARALVSSASTVVAASNLACELFRVARQQGVHTVLNYQIAHHRYGNTLLSDEAIREPEFAPTLTGHMRSAADAAILDEECEMADLILVGSSFARDSFILEGIPEKRIATVSYGTDRTIFAPEQPVPEHRSFHVLFVGQMTQRKGISYLLRAYNQFKGSGTRLTCVGSFSGYEYVFGPYRELFDHIPNVPHATLATIYRGADVFVLPTLLEGMGLVTLEAMASGLPVIVTSNGPGDIVRDGVDGFIVPIRDSGAIAERLEFLRANPKIRREMGLAARDRALEFTWSAYAEKAADVVLSLTGSLQ